RGIEQQAATTDTEILARAIFRIVDASERPFGTLHATHGVLLGRQPSAPVFIILVLPVVRHVTPPLSSKTREHWPPGRLRRPVFRYNGSPFCTGQPGSFILCSTFKSPTS